MKKQYNVNLLFKSYHVTWLYHAASRHVCRLCSGSMWMACLFVSLCSRFVRFTWCFMVAGLLAVIGSITGLSVLILGIIAALFVRRWGFHTKLPNRFLCSYNKDFVVVVYIDAGSINDQTLWIHNYISRDLKPGQLSIVRWSC